MHSTSTCALAVAHFQRLATCLIIFMPVCELISEFTQMLNSNHTQLIHFGSAEYSAWKSYVYKRTLKPFMI